MALRVLCVSGAVRQAHRAFGTAAVLCRRSAPLGPMPNQDIDHRDLEALEKYRSYTRYLRQAERARDQPAWWRTYRQYQHQEDPHHGAERVDIGLPHSRAPRTHQVRERTAVVRQNRANQELERAARLRTFRVPLARVQACWEQTCGPHQVRRLADHYGLFRDLLPGAIFTPRLPLRVTHPPAPPETPETPAQVHYGNHLTPTQAAEAPQVSFEAEEDSLWTLLLTNPDGHLLDSEGEYVHWLVGNLPGGGASGGEELCPYLPPLPPRGTGLHRMVYFLFRQEGPVDFREDLRPSPCPSLAERSFSTLQFYRRHQAHLTPAGLAFYQTQWDASVTHTYHHTLNMKEPVFEFERPPVYHPPQVKVPHGQPLRYLDRYRDGRERSYGIY